MDKTALVAADVNVGAKILAILDQSGLAISVAMWIWLTEYEDWRFMLASRSLDIVEPRKAYGLIYDALERAGFPFDRTPPLLILRTNDPFMRALRRTFGKARVVEGMRLGGQMFGDRFVEDAIVYRIR